VIKYDFKCMALEMTGGDSGGGRLGMVKDVLASKFTRRSDAPPHAGADHPPLNTINKRRSPFLLREQTGTGQTTIDWQGREVQVKERTGSFPPELIEDFKKSLQGQLDRLMDIQRDTPEVFDRLMAEPHFRPFRDVFDRFTLLKEGSEAVGGRAERFLDEAAFNTYFNTDAGFLTAYELRVLKLQDMAINAGILLDDNLPIPNPDVVEDQDINTGPGGKGREVARKVGHWWTERRTRYGREIPIDAHIPVPFTQGVDLNLDSKGDIAVVIGSLSTAFGIGGALVGGPLGAAIGAAVPPAIARVVDAFHRGERVTIEQVHTALEIARTSDPVRREWAREMYQVEPLNLVINAQNEVVIDPDIANNTRIANPAKYAETLRDEIAGENEAIMRAQEAMGVRRELRGGMDIMGLIPGRQEQFAQRNMPLEIATQQEWMRSPQLVDLNGNTCQIQNAAGEWVPNPAFDWQNTDRNVAYNLRQEIHRRRLCEKMTMDFSEIVEWGKDHKAEFQVAIEKAKARLAETPAQRKRELDAQDGRLTADQTRLRAEMPSFTEIQTVLTDIDTRRRALERAQNNVAEVTPHPTGATDATSLLTHVLTDNVRPPAFQVDVTHNGVRVRIESIAAREEAVLERYRNEVDRIANLQPGGNVNAAGQVINKALALAEQVYNAEMVPINRDKEAVNAALTAIRDANTAVNNSFDEFTTRDEQQEEVARSTEEMQEARRDIEGWSRGSRPRIDLSTNALQNESFDELMRRINLSNGARNTNGWPQAENNDPENRDRLLHAMAEARAIAIEPGIGNPSTLYQIATAPDMYAFTETDLLIRSPQAIRDSMVDMIARAPAGSALNAVVLPADVLDEINEVKNEAQARFSARLRAMQTLDREITGRKTLIERQKARIDREGVRTPELDAIERAAPRRDAIRNAINTMQDARLIELLDSAQASTQADRYLPEEQAGNHSIAYVNMMEWIFNHRDDLQAREGAVTGRGVAFTRNSNFLNEDTFRDLIIQGLPRVIYAPVPGVVGPPPPPATFEEAIDRVRGAIQNGDMTKHQFAQFMTENAIYGYMQPLVETI
jgi:hypothetical protein